MAQNASASRALAVVLSLRASVFHCALRLQPSYVISPADRDNEICWALTVEMSFDVLASINGVCFT